MKISFKTMIFGLMTLMSMAIITACSSDNDNNNGGDEKTPPPYYYPNDPAVSTLVEVIKKNEYAPTEFGNQICQPARKP